ncbi:SA1362 family protein [Salinibacillus xinjiangensis]|uniref:Uncharacterized protein n=1 Tax=Salinibacillus xinjiangensis TaxID=1229268 RepID=A0A6G1X6D8_9BACI|nr:SA1362 family protein [Salinibacillus xinjiangensis]MRG86563.1 hypothetical protein [Salinibacillus xinjiangensis]
MSTRKFSVVFYILIGLAVFGVFYQLLFNTAELFKYILMTVGFAALLFGIFYFFMKKRNASGFSNQYKKAVKQSKQKYGGSVQDKQTYNAALRKQKKKKLDYKRPRKKASHLRVIDGKKDKKKNRALF